MTNYKVLQGVKLQESLFYISIYRSGDIIKNNFRERLTTNNTQKDSLFDRITILCESFVIIPDIYNKQNKRKPVHFIAKDNSLVVHENIRDRFGLKGKQKTSEFLTC